MNEKSFSGKELEKALVAGELTHEGYVTLTGMVKASEKEGHISFTQTGCETWVELPTEMIEHADKLGSQPCKDHAHPIMQITLMEPKSSEGKVLIALLSKVTSSHANENQFPFSQSQLQMLSAAGFPDGDSDFSRQLRKLMGQTQISNFPEEATDIATTLSGKSFALAAPNSLTGKAPWPWCQDACQYCRYSGRYCWPCFICAIVASVENVAVAR